LAAQARPTLAREENQMPYDNLVDLVVILIVLLGIAVRQLWLNRKP
jgi:hypothetical protein